MSERWRDQYDAWRLSGPPEPEYDEDGEPIDRDRLAAEAEAAAEERAERRREDMMFDRDNREK